MFNFKEGDRVRTIGERRVGILDKIVDNIALVKYQDGHKEKTAIDCLLPPLEEITITPEKYDEIIKAVMYETAEEAGETDQLDFMLELIGAVGSKIKERLFNGN